MNKSRVEGICLCYYIACRVTVSFRNIIVNQPASQQTNQPTNEDLSLTPYI
jgi:hypothetical protein